MPDDDHELARQRDDGDVVRLLASDAVIACGQRRTAVDHAVGRLDGEPARLGTALLGDASVLAAVGGLIDSGHEPKVGRELLRGIEATDVADRRQEPDRHGDVDARDRHQQFDVDAV